MLLLDGKWPSWSRDCSRTERGLENHIKFGALSTPDGAPNFMSEKSQCCKNGGHDKPYTLPQLGQNQRDRTTFQLSCLLVLALPIFPVRLQTSIFGRSELNFRVRNGNGWTLALINTNYFNHRSD